MTDPSDRDRPARILIVEDDAEVAAAVRRMLSYEQYDTKIARDGNEALARIDLYVPDLILLDLGLPGIDGVEILKEVRRVGSDIPVLIVTARDAIADRVESLDLGADDYLTKPFDRTELLARIRALLRRRPPRGTSAMAVGDLILRPDSRQVERAGRQIDLTTREYELLEFLMRNAGIVVSRERLLEDVWEYDPMALTNTVDVTVSNLRHKLERGGKSRLLHTIRGAGYVVRAQKS